MDTADAAGRSRPPFGYPSIPLDRTGRTTLADGIPGSRSGPRRGVTPGEGNASAVTMAGYLPMAPPQHAHETLEPIVAGRSGGVEMSKAQRVELLTVFLRHCSVLGHPDCYARWGPELEALSVTLLDSAPEEAVRGLRVVMSWKNRVGDYERTQELAGQVPARVLTQCSTETQADLALVRSDAASRLGDLEVAEALGAEAVDAADRSGEARLRGHARICLATTLKQRGRFQEALSLYTQAEALHQLSGDLTSMARGQLNRGLLLNRLGRVREAATVLDGAYRRACEIPHSQLILRTRLGMGLVAVRRGELDSARRHLVTGWLEARRLHMPRERALALEFLGEALILAGRVDLARRVLTLCRRTGARLVREGDLTVECGIRETMLALATGDSRAACVAAEAARAGAGRLGLPWEEAQALRLEAIALYRIGRRSAARTALSAARGKLRSMNEQLEIRLVDQWQEFLRHGDRHREPPVHPAQSALSMGVLASRSEETIFGAPQTRAIEPGGWRQSSVVPQSNRRGDRTRARPAHALHEIWRQLGLITRSDRLAAVLRAAEMLAVSDGIVLVQGETGTGKELVARGVHILSGRQGPLVPVNTGALPTDLIEAELFGVAKGAYTSAGQSRAGLAIAAQGGTLFLDEIGEVDHRAQIALLRFLDSGEVRPVGSTRILHARTGIVAATNRPLKELVGANRFRADLYYRLAQGVLELPPLRERPEDLRDLVESLWVRQTGRRDLPEGLLEEEALGIMRRYDWPGNIRELDHYLRRVRLAHAGEAKVSTQLLERHLRTGAEVLVSRPSSKRARRTRGSTAASYGARALPDTAQIEQALRAANGNRSRAARNLGIHRGVLYRLLGQMARTRPEAADRSEPAGGRGQAGRSMPEGPRPPGEIRGAGDDNLTGQTGFVS